MTTTAADAWEALHRAQIVVNRRATRFPEFQELPAREYDLLFNLTRADDNGMRLKVLNQYLPITQSSLSRMLDRLERKGLIRKWEDPEDARGLRIALTDLGHDVQERIGRDYDQHIHQLVTAALTPEEQDTLIRLTTKLRTSI